MPTEHAVFWTTQVSVAEVLVDVGDYVEAGQVVATADLEAAQKAKQDLEEARSLLVQKRELEVQKQQLTIQKLNLNRREKINWEILTVLRNRKRDRDGTGKCQL